MCEITVTRSVKISLYTVAMGVANPSSVVSMVSYLQVVITNTLSLTTVQAVLYITDG